MVNETFKSKQAELKSPRRQYTKVNNRRENSYLNENQSLILSTRCNSQIVKIIHIVNVAQRKSNQHALIIQPRSKKLKREKKERYGRITATWSMKINIELLRAIIDHLYLVIAHHPS